MPNTEAEFRSSRIRIVGTALFITITALALFLFLPKSSWVTAFALFLCKDLLYIIYAFHKRDAWVQRILLLLVILTGFNFVEDWLLVSFLKDTHYSLSESHPPTLWHTPIFGVLAWPAMTMELALLGAWLVGRLRGLGVLAGCALGVVMIPCYDELALHLHWWRYDGARLFFHTPYFVIAAESLLAGAIGWAALSLKKEGYVRLMWVGMIIGSYMLIITYLTYLMMR